MNLSDQDHELRKLGWASVPSPVIEKAGGPSVQSQLENMGWGKPSEKPIESKQPDAERTCDASWIG